MQLRCDLSSFDSWSVNYVFNKGICYETTMGKLRRIIKINSLILMQTIHCYYMNQIIKFSNVKYIFMNNDNN